MPGTSAALSVGNQQKRAIMKMATSSRVVTRQEKKKIGRPKKFNEEQAQKVLNAIAMGKTLIEISQEIELGADVVYDWIEKDENFAERYRIARQKMASSLVDEMIADSKALTPEQALAGKVKFQVAQWVATKYNPQTFGDIKRVELKGEINHRHIHELSDAQKQRIAESWLLSQQSNKDTPGITAETTGPDIESVAVQEICETEQGERSKRKRSAATRKASPTGKRKRKASFDEMKDET